MFSGSDDDEGNAEQALRDCVLQRDDVWRVHEGSDYGPQAFFITKLAGICERLPFSVQNEQTITRKVILSFVHLLSPRDV